MSQAEDLLNSLSENDISVYTVDPETEGRIVVGDDRFITVPEELKRIAVQHDHDIETVVFDCPRYWDEHDMSKMKIYINYMRKDGYKDCYWAQNVTVDTTDSNIMHFEWTISRNVTEVKGNLSFLVCIKTTDEEGNESNHWNSELCQDMYVSEGLECMESAVNDYPDIITQILLRMDYVEEIATPESMQEYVDDFLTNDPTAKEQIRYFVNAYLEENDADVSKILQQFVLEYMEKHPTIFVVGSVEPTFKSVWFDTEPEVDDTNTTKFIVSSKEQTEDCLWFNVSGESGGSTVDGDGTLKTAFYYDEETGDLTADPSLYDEETGDLSTYSTTYDESNGNVEAAVSNEGSNTATYTYNFEII